MRPVSGKRMSEILERKGWILERVRGSHHAYRHPITRLRISVPVHANRDLATGTQRTIMRQAGLTDVDLS
jgi:predicted RNA binding protein YcfA (HicA-like mRNA interferase family)